MIRYALVRPPGKSFKGCISSHPARHSIDYALALDQHAKYCDTLMELGLELISLSPDHEHPDSCFVEDTAVLRGDKAFITRMARDSRRGEEYDIVEVLEEYKRIKRAFAPATIEGGDVIHFPDKLITGITQRTNILGVDQMVEWLEVESSLIEDQSIIHLKSHVTYLGRNTIIVTPAYRNHPVLSTFERIVVPANEEYAANTLAIDDVILMPANCKKSIKLVEEHGFAVSPTNMSEFEKCEGALTCLSLIF
ncbi:MAG: dimethylarginine dimethylaminohydrolase family protein [Promethearchaeota archaeon]